MGEQHVFEDVSTTMRAIRPGPGTGRLAGDLEQEDDHEENPYIATMIAAIPELRVVAMSLARNRDQADDLVQDTLLRALEHIDSFKPGSMVGWLITILRNSFFSECRRRRREVPDVDGRIAEALEMRPEQGIRLELGQVMEAVGGLSATHRSAISLVALSGNSYVEAAKASGCAVGTMKSRTYRARTRLFESLNHRCDRRSSDKQSSYP